MWVAVKQMDYEEADERVKEDNDASRQNRSLYKNSKRYSGGFGGEGNEAGEKSGDCGDGL